jgi:tRNA (guanosine-2'-O-)-methyltransferase
MLTAERRQKIDRVVAGRNFDTAVVLEGIYDRGNISAVMRTAEGLGFANIHVIETQEKFKEANRVAQGADKWVETTKWKQSSECIKALKAQGYKICVTTLEASKPLSEIDFSGKTALVLGNEKDGASPEMIAAADERMIIPMPGFVQSFNISVAGALCLYHILQDRTHRRGSNADLTPEQQDILKAYYYLRTQDSAADSLKELFSRGTLA